MVLEGKKKGTGGGCEKYWGEKCWREVGLGSGWVKGQPKGRVRRRGDAHQGLREWWHLEVEML